MRPEQEIRDGIAALCPLVDELRHKGMKEHAANVMHQIRMLAWALGDPNFPAIGHTNRFMARMIADHDQQQARAREKS